MAEKNKTVAKPEAKKDVKSRGQAPKLGKFFQEVKTELKKVTWPSRKTLITQTIVVVVTVIILSIFLGIADGIFSLLYATIK